MLQKRLDFGLTLGHNNGVMDDKGRSMFTVLFPSGRTLTLTTKTLAETYISAYRGVLISQPVENESIRISAVDQK